MNKPTSDELEKFIHRELRALPPRPAPTTLEIRVRTALEHRAAIPWYHQSWSGWPAGWRAAFLVVASIVAGVMVAGGAQLIVGFEPARLGAAVMEQVPALARLHATVVWLLEFAGRSAAAIPSLWLWSGLAAFLMLNGAFLGLSTVAYRTLFRKN